MQADFQEEWLTAYLDDELDDELSEVVRQRLADDPTARQMLEDLKRVRQLVGNLPRWSGGDLRQQFSSVATLASTEIDELTEDVGWRVISDDVVRQPPSSSWRLWLGACALAASLLLVAGLTWTRFFSPAFRSTVAMQTADRASEGAAASDSAASSVGAAGRLSDEEKSNFRNTPSPSAGLGALDSARSDANETFYAAPTLDSKNRRNSPSEAALAELSDERLNAPRGRNAESGMPGAAFGAASQINAADPSIAAPISAAPLSAALEFRSSGMLRQEHLSQLAMLPANTRLGRSQSWQEQEASQALSQVVHLIAPTQLQAYTESLPAIAQSQSGDRFGQVVEEKNAPADSLASGDLGAGTREMLESQQRQLPIALVQVGGGMERANGLFGELVANHQLLAIETDSIEIGKLQSDDAQSIPQDLKKESDKATTLGLALTPQEQNPLQIQPKSEAEVAVLPPSAMASPAKPELSRNIELGGAGGKNDLTKPKESAGQQSRSQAAIVQSKQPQTAQSAATIVLFVTRREAQQIIDSIPSVNQDAASQKAGKSAMELSNAWWFIPSDNAANRNENPDDKVILLLNANYEL